LAANAHHSRANFDLDTVVEINGTVARWQYRNPHAFLHLDVVTEAGETERWVVELGSIPNLKQIDMHRETLNVGDNVTVMINPEKNSDKHYGFFKSMTLPDGSGYVFSDVFDYSNKAKAAAAETSGSTDFTGVWDEERSPRQTLLGTGLPDYPVTDAGLKQVSLYDPADNPSNYCNSAGLPSMVGTPYAIEIRKVGENYIINHEFPAATRIIHMGVPTEIAKPSIYGHSVGHLEGQTLVVESSGFANTKWGIGPGLDSGVQKHVVERYVLKDEGHVLEIGYTVTDPDYLSAPYKKTHIKRLTSGYEITAYEDCDPEAAKMHLELEGND
jgi:hypothetical protein